MCTNSTIFIYNYTPCPYSDTMRDMMRDNFIFSTTSESTKKLFYLGSISYAYLLFEITHPDLNLWLA